MKDILNKHMLNKLKNGILKMLNDKSAQFLIGTFAIIFGFIKSLANHVYDQDEININFLPSLVYAVICYIILNLGYFIINQHYKIKEINFKSPQKLWWSFFFILLISYSICWLAFWPGTVSWDNWCIARSGINIAVQHPIFYCVLIQLFVEIGQFLGGVHYSIIIYTGLQIFIVSAALSCILSNIFQARIPRILKYISVLMFAIVPIYPVYAIYNVKDVYWSLCFIGYNLLIYQFINSAPKIQSKKFYINLSLCVIGLIVLRNNGIYIAIASLLALIALKTPYRKQLTFVFGICILTQILCSLTLKALDKKPLVQEKVAAPIQQVAAVVKYDGVMTTEQKIFFEKLMPFDKMKELYNPYSIDSVKWTGRRYGFDYLFLQKNSHQFLKYWWQMMPNNFEIYVKAFLQETFWFWAPRLKKVNFNTTILPDQNKDFSWAAENGYIETHIISASIQHSLRSYYSYAGYFFKEGVLFWLILACSLLYYLKRRKLKYLTIYLPCILLWGTIMIAAPASQQFRYILPFAYLLPYFICTLFISQEDNSVTLSLETLNHKNLNKKTKQRIILNYIKNHFSWIIAFVCLSLFAFNFWLFYPGYITHDWAFVMTKLDFDDHHPVIYPYLLSNIYKIFGIHIYYPLLFNLIPFYLGIYAITLGLYYKFKSKWCLLGFLIICIGNIFSYNIRLHSSFSSPMFVFLLWAIVLYQILIGINSKNMIVACIAFIFATISRHNALIQTYPIFFIYSWIIVQKSKPSHKLLKYTGWCLLFAGLTLAVSIGIPSLLKEGKSYPSTHIFLHQIAGACVPNNDQSCFKKEWYENGKNFEDVKKEYSANPLDADKMNRHWCPNHPFKNTNLENLQHKWLQSIIKYPANYIYHISKFIKNMWMKKVFFYINISDNEHCIAKKDCSWLKNIFTNDELYYKASQHKIVVFNLLKKVFPTIPTILFVLLNFIFFILSGILFIQKKNIISLYILSSSVAGIASSFIFCIFSPVTDSRYIYPVLINTLISTIGIILYFCDTSKELCIIKIKSVAKKHKKIMMLTAFLSVLLGIYLYINRPITARTDIYTSYTDTPLFLVHQKGDNIPAPEAAWMPKFGNRGVVVQENAHKTTFSITALQDADITIALRGPDERDAEGKTVEKWVEYTSFKINGKPVVSSQQTVWHNKPYRYILHAKAAHTYKVKLKWRKK